MAMQSSIQEILSKKNNLYKQQSAYTNKIKYIGVFLEKDE